MTTNETLNGLTVQVDNHSTGTGWPTVDDVLDLLHTNPWDHD